MTWWQKRLLEGAVALAGFGLGMLILESIASEREVDPDAGVPRVPVGREPAPEPWKTALGSPPRFVDVTRSAGIRFSHENGMTGTYRYLEIMGAGVGVFDYDGDGYLDIYFVNGNHLLKEPSPSIINRLYHNNGDGTFHDVTARAGVGDPGFGQGCCAGDYDNDGDTDLYVSNYGPNILYRNNGDGTFSDVTETAGVTDPGWGQSSSFLDYDGDGWLDLYVQNYLSYTLETDSEAYIYVGDRKVVDYPAPGGFTGAADHLYRNNGDGTFSDVTVSSGMYRPDGKGMGCACVDLDEDGHTDIYITNDGMENFLFRNRGDGTFEETGLIAGVALDGTGASEASMGVDVGDYDGDGRLDMIVPCVWQEIFTLYRNEGGHFTDVSWRVGLGQATAQPTGFNPNFLDYDNDGDLDLYFTTGRVRMNELAPADASYLERYGLCDVLLANDGAGAFFDVSKRAGSHFSCLTIGRGAATGDLDNDGDIDLVINNLTAPAAVLRNDTESGHWITLLLKPRTGNRDALGTNVRIEAGGRTARSVVHGGVTYLSQIDRRVHFGLGSCTKIDRLEIRWPHGERQAFTDVPVDRFVTVEEGATMLK